LKRQHWLKLVADANSAYSALSDDPTPSEIKSAFRETLDAPINFALYQGNAIATMHNYTVENHNKATLFFVKCFKEIYGVDGNVCCFITSRDGVLWPYLIASSSGLRSTNESLQMLLSLNSQAVGKEVTYGPSSVVAWTKGDPTTLGLILRYLLRWLPIGICAFLLAAAMVTPEYHTSSIPIDGVAETLEYQTRGLYQHWAAPIIPFAGIALGLYAIGWFMRADAAMSLPGWRATKRASILSSPEKLSLNNKAHEWLLQVKRRFDAAVQASYGNQLDRNTKGAQVSKSQLPGQGMPPTG